MIPFEIVTVAVGVAGTALASTRYFRTGSVLGELGHQGRIWFAHLDEQPPDERPSEDAVDAPIPRRPPRPRMTIG